MAQPQEGPRGPRKLAGLKLRMDQLRLQQQTDRLEALRLRSEELGQISGRMEEAGRGAEDYFAAERGARTGLIQEEARTGALEELDVAKDRSRPVIEGAGIALEGLERGAQGLFGGIRDRLSTEPEAPETVLEPETAAPTEKPPIEHTPVTVERPEPVEVDYRDFYKPEEKAPETPAVAQPAGVPPVAPVNPITKPGVKWEDMSDTVTSQWPKVEQTAMELLGRRPVVTSGREGKHKDDSLHYEGNAFDLRTWGLTNDKKEQYRARLADTLGPDWDVLIEEDHIHVEYEGDRRGAPQERPAQEAPRQVGDQQKVEQRGRRRGWTPLRSITDAGDRAAADIFSGYEDVALRGLMAGLVPGKMGERLEDELWEDVPRELIQTEIESGKVPGPIASMVAMGRVIRFPIEVIAFKPFAMAANTLTRAGQVRLMGRLMTRFPGLISAQANLPRASAGLTEVAPGAASAVAFGAGIESLELAGDVAAGEPVGEAAAHRGAEFAKAIPAYGVFGGALGFVFGSIAAHYSSRALGGARGRPGAEARSEVLDAFTRLGLRTEATEAEIKSAYRNLSKRYHPDAGGSAEEFAAINNAYEVALKAAQGKAPRPSRASQPDRPPTRAEADAAVRERGRVIRSEAEKVIQEEAAIARREVEAAEAPRKPGPGPETAPTAAIDGRPTIQQDESLRTPFRGEEGDEAIVLPPIQEAYGITDPRVWISEVIPANVEGQNLDVYLVQDAEGRHHYLGGDELRRPGDIELEQAGQAQMFEPVVEGEPTARDTEFVPLDVLQVMWGGGELPPDLVEHPPLRAAVEKYGIEEMPFLDERYGYLSDILGEYRLAVERGREEEAASWEKKYVDEIGEIEEWYGEGVTDATEANWAVEGPVPGMVSESIRVRELRGKIEHLEAEADKALATSETATGEEQEQALLRIHELDKEIKSVEAEIKRVEAELADQEGEPQEVEKPDIGSLTTDQLEYAAKIADAEELDFAGLDGLSHNQNLEALVAFSQEVNPGETIETAWPELTGEHPELLTFVLEKVLPLRGGARPKAQDVGAPDAEVPQPVARAHGINYYATYDEAKYVYAMSPDLKSAHGAEIVKAEGHPYVKLDEGYVIQFPSGAYYPQPYEGYKETKKGRNARNKAKIEEFKTFEFDTKYLPTQVIHEMLDAVVGKPPYPKQDTGGTHTKLIEILEREWPDVGHPNAIGLRIEALEEFKALDKNGIEGRWQGVSVALEQLQEKAPIKKAEAPAEPTGPGAFLKGFIEAANESMAEARARISNVRWAPILKDEANAILFDIDGVTYRGELKGRNKDIVLSEPRADAALALRVVLDGEARLFSKPQPVEKPEGEVPAIITKGLKEAAEAWQRGQAYIDGNGNYHVRMPGKDKGPIAPWNKEVKKAFPGGVADFEKAVPKMVDKTELPAALKISMTEYGKARAASLPTRGRGSKVRRQQRREEAEAEWEGMAVLAIMRGEVKPGYFTGKGLSESLRKDAREAYALSEDPKGLTKPELEFREHQLLRVKNNRELLDKLRAGETTMDKAVLRAVVRSAARLGETIYVGEKPYVLEPKIHKVHTGADALMYWKGPGASGTFSHDDAARMMADRIISDWDDLKIQARLEKYEGDEPIRIESEEAAGLYEEAFDSAKERGGNDGYAAKSAMAEVARLRQLTPEQYDRTMELLGVLDRHDQIRLSYEEAKAALIFRAEEVIKHRYFHAQVKDPLRNIDSITKDYSGRRFGVEMSDQLDFYKKWLGEGDVPPDLQNPWQMAERAEANADALRAFLGQETKASLALDSKADLIKSEIKARKAIVEAEVERLEKEIGDLPQVRAKEGVPLRHFKTTVARAWPEGNIMDPEAPVLSDGHTMIWKSEIPDTKTPQARLRAILKRKVGERGPIKWTDRVEQGIWREPIDAIREHNEEATLLGITPLRDNDGRFSTNPLAYLKGSKGQVVIVNANKLRFLTDIFPNHKIYLHPKEDRAVALFPKKLDQGREASAIVMPMRTEGIENQVDLELLRKSALEYEPPKKPGKDNVPKPGGPVGSFRSTADLEAPFEQKSAVVPTGGETTFNPIETVELTRLAMELLGSNRIFMAQQPWYWGAFYPIPDFTLPGGEVVKGKKINLNPLLGKDYEHFARTLAHEAGHLVDFLDEQTMARGNVLGRIGVLRKYMMNTLDKVPTDPSRAITKDERKKIRKDATKAAGPDPGAENEAAHEAWLKDIRERYRERILELVQERNLLTKEAVWEEMMLLSEWWRPFDREVAGAQFIAYRESAVELYADALSVLLNSPGSLQEKAPKFFDAFVAYFERKPEVKAAYDAIQELIGGDAKFEARLEELEEGFEAGREKVVESEKAREEMEERGLGLLGHLRQAFFRRADPGRRAEAKRLGKDVAPFSAERSFRLAEEEFRHGDNPNRALLEDVARLVHKPLEEAGLTPDNASSYMVLKRIAYGDRGGWAVEAQRAIMEITGEDTWAKARAAYKLMKPGQVTAEEVLDDGTTVQEIDPFGDADYDPALAEMAETGILNPYGYTPDQAKNTLEALEKKLGTEKYAELVRIVDDELRPILQRPIIDAVEAGVISRKMWETKIQPNLDFYAPFAVLDYFNGRMGAGIHRQIGTVKAIAGPYETYTLKSMALNRAVQYQRVKRALVEVLPKDFPGQFGQILPVSKRDAGMKAPPGQKNIRFFIDGRLYYVSMDSYIAEQLDRKNLGAAQRVADWLESRTYGIFHPLYVTLSLGWQTRNIVRDLKRTYKNLAVIHHGKPSYRQVIEAFLDLVRLPVAYGKTRKAAWDHARRRYNPFIREMLDDRALGRAFHSFEPHEDSPPMVRLMERYGILKPSHEGLKGKVQKYGRPVEVLGVFQETWSKAAAFEVLGRMGLEGAERAAVVRNYSGTPDSTQRGLASDAPNSLMMYYNVIVAGIASDWEAGWDPRSATAAGHWFRSVIIDYQFKALMAAMSLGALGAGAKEWFDRIPEYDKEKYLIVPLPPFTYTAPDGAVKSVYYPLPHDDTNRMVAATMWALLMSQGSHANFGHALSVLSGEFPGANPGLDILWKWGKYATGENPRDEFRDRDVVPSTEWEAGGWPRAREMLRWTSREFGILSQLAGYWTRKAPGVATGVAEKIARSIPGLSALVKISDQGSNEERWWELEAESKERAKLRADLGSDTRARVRDRSRLNRFGVDRLDEREKAQRLQLNAWYRLFYLPLTEEMEDARDSGRQDEYDRLIEELESSVDEIGDLQTGRSGAPRPPVAPKAPRPPRVPG